MYHILIVDDSVLDMNCITFLIQKQELPLHTTTAVNGQEALILLQNPAYHFDILFTDIRMPFLDGLALSKEARRLSPDIKIIIFSGFSDFEYAKTAITIGVEDYLMKPVVPEEFITLMEKVIQSVDEAHRQAENACRQKALLKNHLLWLAINQGTTDTAVAFTEKYAVLMLIECDNEFFSTQGLSFQEKLEALLPFSFDYLNLYPTRSLLFIKEEEGRTKKEAYLYASAQSICLSADEEFGQKCYIAYQTISEKTSLNQVYQELEKKIETRFFFPERNLFLPNDQEHYSASGHISTDILSHDLKLQDYASLDLHLQDLFESLKHEKTHSLIYVKYCFTELMKEIIYNLPESKRPDINCIAEKIYSSSNILELMDMTLNLAGQLKERQSDEPKGYLKSEKIKQYIYQNYAQPLTLNDIAAYFYISPNYLCSIFKKEVGSNLMKFINEYRLHKAEELLLTTQMKVNKIAEMVGYGNTSYFCQRFRDYYGDTPEGYRQREG